LKESNKELLQIELFCLDGTASCINLSFLVFFNIL